MDSETGKGVHGELAGASNTLVVASTSDSNVEDLCPELLTVGEPDRTNLLWVTYTSTPDDCLRRWLQHAGERPAEMKILSVGDVMRSAAAARTGGGRMPTASVVDSLANPGDVTGLGIKISEQLQEWSRNDNQTVVCFDSLTTALQYVDLQTTYKFLHVLTGRFDTVDAIAHFHVDPDAHDDATVNTLKSLFDAVVEYTDEGGWRVSSR